MLIRKIAGLLYVEAKDSNAAKNKVLKSLKNRKEIFTMPYVVTEACIKCKYMDCCEVCL